MLTVYWGKGNVAQMTNIIGFHSNIPPDALGGKGRPPVPAERTLLLEVQTAGERRYTDDRETNSRAILFLPNIT